MDNLGLTSIVEGQLGMYIVSNDADKALSDAMTETVALDLSSGDVTLTAAQYTRAIYFSTTGNSVSRTINVPASKRLFVVANGGSATLIVARGTGNVTIAAGEAFVIYTDGGTNTLFKIASNPTLLTGSLIYKGTWNASTNSPTITGGSGVLGWFYKVTTAGTSSIDGISSWNVGDELWFDGTEWNKQDGIAAEVISVAGRTGAVVIADSDITYATQTANKSFMSAASGGPATPAFRAMVYADLPTGLPGKPRDQVVTYSASVTLDLSVHDSFVITLTGNITIDFTGGVNNQSAKVQLIQDSTGSRLVTWGTSVTFGSDIATAVASTGVGKIDYFGVNYNSTASKYHMLAVARGY